MSQIKLVKITKDNIHNKNINHNFTDVCYFFVLNFSEIRNNVIFKKKLKCSFLATLLLSTPCFC